MENVNQKQEITDLKTENTILQQKIKELERNSENKGDDKSADL